MNIAELLKDCPTGMELDSVMFDNVTFVGVNTGQEFPIEIKVGCITKYLTKEGCYHRFDCIPSAKCVIFPKGKTTWEGFQRPFKDGDIIFTHANCLKVGVGNTWISIYKENRNGGVATYVDCAEDGDGYYSDLDGDKAFLCMEEDILRQRFATEEEKQKLFDAIKANGYKWNPETKTLEKLIVPKFKVGDRIKHKNLGIIYTIKEIATTLYYTDKQSIFFEHQDNWEVVEKFDITTLIPFESKVLVRDYSLRDIWRPAVFGGYLANCKDDARFMVVGGLIYEKCIPYEENRHLLNTINDCDDYYKTWK